MKLADQLSTPQKQLACLIDRLRDADTDPVLLLTYTKAINEILREMTGEVLKSIPTYEALVESHVKSLVREDLAELLTKPETTLFKG